MEEQAINEQQLPAPESGFRYFPFFNRKQPVFVLVLLGILFYCTSLYNEYALDDGIVIHQNNYVLQGIRGIKHIMTKDLYDAFYRRMNATDQLAGGRYHPLSSISFAVEQEILGRYRTGYYIFVQDLNGNGRLDHDKVGIMPDPASAKAPDGTTINWTKTSGKNTAGSCPVQAPLNQYEYNDFTDLNHDGIAQENECYNCWDTNMNFHNDPSEDLNADGVFNEVDCQVRGSFLRHFDNMCAYILACIFLYLVFRRHFFKDNQDMAFLAALIFLAHPLHTEIVANVKGRDEIFSVIFIALTFLFSFKFIENKKLSTLAGASFMLLLALLSKESAMMMLVLVPLAMYVFNKTKIKHLTLCLLLVCFLAIVALMIGWKLKWPSGFPMALIFGGALVYIGFAMLFFRKIFKEMGLNALMAGFFTLFLLYLGLRLNAVNIIPGTPDTEILNNPYLLATGEERFATKIFIFLKYLQLALFPHPLRSDYSYDTIAYQHFGDIGFILSLLVNLVLLVSGIVLLIKRHVMGFAIISYYVFLILVCNLLFDVGAIMHEGFLFHASIGIAMAFAWLLLTGFEKLQSMAFATRRVLLLSLLAIILFLYGCKTWERNWDWKNDVTLFLKDVKTTPNSVLVLGNAGARWIDLADTKEITGIDLPGQDPNVFNDYNGTLKITDEEMREGGYSTKREAALYRGMGYLKHAIELHPRYVNGYLNLGLASFKLNKDLDAIYYWKIAEHLYPENPYLSNYYRVYSGILKDRGNKAFGIGKLQEAITAYKLYTLVLPGDADGWFDLGGAYYTQQHYGQARKALEKALLLKPGSEEIKKALQTLPPG